MWSNGLLCYWNFNSSDLTNRVNHDTLCHLRDVRITECSPYHLTPPVIFLNSFNITQSHSIDVQKKIRERDRVDWTKYERYGMPIEWHPNHSSIGRRYLS